MTATRHLTTPDDEIADLAAKSSAALVEAINALIRARVLVDPAAHQAAIVRAAGVLGSMLALADLYGRRRMQLLAERAEVRDARRRASLVAEAVARLDAAPVLLPRVEFTEAVQDVLSRHPEVAPGWRATADVYAERHGFACAKAMDVAVAERVQKVIEETVRSGSRPNPRKVIAELGDWSDAYASVVYETNVRTAYTAGMWARLDDPAVARVIPGMRFVSALLPTSRPNHAAAHGLMAPTNSPLWETYSPPMGYRCACALREISIFEAKEKRLLDAEGRMLTVYPPNFAAAYPDPGFGRGRPDRVLASGSIA